MRRFLAAALAVALPDPALPGMGDMLDAAAPPLGGTLLADLTNAPACAPPCPAGFVATPRLPVLAHRPSANGCGPQSGSHAELGAEGRYQIKEPFGLIACCNAHAPCGLAFETCENRFERCMASVCAALPPPSVESATTVTEAELASSCTAQAHRFSSLTREFGCSFHRSQVTGDEGSEPNCECTPAAQASASVATWLAEFNQEYGGELPQPRADLGENGDLLWNFSVSPYKRYARWVEKIMPNEMVLLNHDHIRSVSQKSDDDAATTPPPPVKRHKHKDKLPLRHSYPAHWGSPPSRQTKDLRPLPAGYGMGSGTVAKWIRQKLDEDKAAGIVSFPEQQAPPKKKLLKSGKCIRTDCTMRLPRGYIQ